MQALPDHQPDRHRFVCKVDGEEAVLKYRLLPDNGVEFTSTFVPESLRGQGIAEKLVRTGLAWARDQGYDIQASCWYVARFLKRGRKS